MHQSHSAFEIAPTEQCPRPDPALSDATLAQNAQAGDAESLDCLLCRYWPDLCRHARCACSGNPAEAQDVCQEACLKAVRSLDRFVAGRSFRAWVFAFIDNEAKNSGRNLKKVGTWAQEIDIHIIETMSVRAETKSEADMTTLLSMLSSQVPNLRQSRRQSATFMIEHYARQQEFPTVRMIAQATHSSQGAAERNHKAILTSWRHILAVAELVVPTRRERPLACAPKSKTLKATNSI